MGKRIFGLAGIVLAGSLATASASTVELDYIGQLGGAANAYFTFNGRSVGASAGEFTFDVVGTGERLTGWCVDIDHRLITSSTPYVADPALLDAGVVAGLDRLFTQHYAEVQNAVSSAAFQIAVWELVYDSADIGLDSGAFRLEARTASGVAEKAAEFLNLGSASGGYDLTFLRSTAAPVASQNLVSATPSAVPLPAPAVLLLAGLGALGGLRRKSRG